MCKKLTIFTIIFVIILNLFSLCYKIEAATKNIEVNLSGSTNIKQDTKTVELTLSLGKFTEVEENIVLGYQANVEYNKNMFDSVKFEGLNGWTVNYESETNTVIGELSSATAKANTNIAKITLTLKDGIQPETTGEFKLNNLQLTDSDELDITVNKSITITMEKIEEPTLEPEPNPEPKPGIEEELQKENKQQITKTNTQNTNTPVTKKVSNLPYAGIQNFIVITLLIVFIIGVLALIRYKTIKIK